MTSNEEIVGETKPVQLSTPELIGENQGQVGEGVYANPGDDLRPTHVDDPDPGPPAVLKSAVPKTVHAWSLLRPLFIKLRRLRRQAPTERFLLALMSGQEDSTSIRKFMETACAVYRRALLVTNGDRPCACVLGLLELRALDGYRATTAKSIGRFTGLRSGVVAISLEQLRRQQAVYLVQDCVVENEYGLVNPLPIDQYPPGAHHFSDPIEVLRLDLEALDALPPDVFKWSVIRGGLQVARDRLAAEETETLANIANLEALLASDKLLLREIGRRVVDHTKSVEHLRRELSGLRWSKRNPFGADAQQEDEPLELDDDIMPWVL